MLEDASCQEAPLDWCRAVVDLYYKYDADRVIGEVNNGGDLIESLMRTVDRDISLPERPRHSWKNRPAPSQSPRSLRTGARSPTSACSTILRTK
ncbi:MAG: hypothetical protein V8T87_10110 [Victivallales bacterium]